MRFASIVIVMLALTPDALGIDFVPAALASGPESIQATFRLPQGLADGIYSLRCHATVNSLGKAIQFACLSAKDTNPPSLVGAVTAAGRAARFEPARDQGEPVAWQRTNQIAAEIEAEMQW